MTSVVEHVMGMPIVVDVRDEGKVVPVVDKVFRPGSREVDARFSTYKAMTILAGGRVLKTSGFPAGDDVAARAT